MPKLHELQQQRNQLAADMRALHDDHEERQWTGDAQEKWNKMDTDLRSLDELIQREERLRDLDERAIQGGEGENRGGGDESRDEGDVEARAFGAFLRHGLADMDPELREMVREMRAQAASVGDKGGYTVPTEFRNKVVEKMKAFGGIASVCQILETDGGNTIEWATTDGTAEEGELIGENGQAGEEDVTFGTENLGAKKLSSKVIRVSNELLNDSGVDIEALLTGRIATRIFRGEARLLVQGTGTGSPVQPKGLKASATLSHSAAAAALLAYSDLLKLKHKVDPAYRNGLSVRFAFNDQTFLILKELKDTQGRPLWKPDLAGVAPATIDGDQFVIDQAIDDVGASATSLFYGDFDRYILRRVRYMALKRLLERYADFDQTAFLAFHRFDCVLEDTSAIAKLVHPAS